MLRGINWLWSKNEFIACLLVLECQSKSSAADVSRSLLYDVSECVKSTKQKRFSFLFKGTYSTFRAIPLRRQCYRATLKANANDAHRHPYEPSMGVCQGFLQQTENHYGLYTHIKHGTDIPEHTTKAKEAKRDQDTGAHTFAQKMDLCPAGFQMDKLSVCR